MSRSSLPPKIRGIVEYQLEHYFDSKRQLKEERRNMLPSNTPKYSLEPPGSSEASRTTENTAVKMMTTRYLIEIAKTVDAIEYITDRLTDEDKRLVDLVYWKGTHTIEGAGMELNMSRRTAYRHVDAILIRLAKELGFIP